VGAAVGAADAIDRVEGREQGQYRGGQEPSHALIMRRFPIHMLTFAVMTALGCIAACALVNNGLIGERIRRYGHMVLPVALIATGAWTELLEQVGLADTLPRVNAPDCSSCRCGVADCSGCFRLGVRPAVICIRNRTVRADVLAEPDRDRRRRSARPRRSDCSHSVVPGHTSPGTVWALGSGCRPMR
jgi:hypothetical protein